MYARMHVRMPHATPDDGRHLQPTSHVRAEVSSLNDIKDEEAVPVYAYVHVCVCGCVCVCAREGLFPQ